ncbi:phosphatase domain-containing putative toxin [Derxia lacustris]|uniref:phosphatase domain-containing putative toxin n=1 Tax=Derxia lacustris TaxID=764842 RepID=UPI000A1727E4|nr:ATP-binding cassette domain-containing protein [Derxia lacustris]
MNPATAESPAPLLELAGFGVAFRERTILSSIDLRIADRECVVLLGPAGTGKSTLLRTVAGHNSANPSMRTWGEARYQGRPLDAGERPLLVAQSARLMLSSVLENLVSGLPERAQLTPPQQREVAVRLLEAADLHDLVDRLDLQVADLPLGIQRHLAVARAAVSGPRLLFVDEPTAGLPPADAARLLAYLGALAHQRSLLVVLHNQLECRQLGGRAVLIAGGSVRETQPIPRFFDAPGSGLARDFVRSGSCDAPSPDARPEDLAPDALPPIPPPPAAQRYVSDAFGPRGFLWLRPGQLAGTPRPGVFFDTQIDLEALRRVGVTLLINLTEQPGDPALLAEHGIAEQNFPVRDMRAPDLELATAICRAIDAALARGQVVAAHCHAGLGRTGTLLAAWLIWHGQDALGALDAVRRIEQRWVQSREQADFLGTFADHLARRAVFPGRPDAKKPSAP